ncbi:hypothetical protein [Vulcanisaeta sp. JCM 16159]|uniref:hypothetical protein n=1 Tax=Vulcanisaeta sp. JCM 16159 TaxID=1295371 RepID=UPI000A49881E|nr:hypothetical protein [Vulcanisaeta sp. JCM 16159]
MGNDSNPAVGPGPKVCWGVKVNGSKRLRCGEPVDDPRVIEETMKLINEFLSRVEKHKAVLLSESATPFDDAINALSNWLGEIRAKIGESSDENIANLRKALLNSGKKMLELAEEAREKWLKTYKPELEELIERLRSGKARVIITGELLNKDKTFTAHLYVEDLAIEIDRVAKSGSITINISLMRLRETYVVVPRLFDNERLRAMQCGLMLTDGSIDKKGYPEMGTHQLWQVFAWSLAWPGKNHMHISGLSLNDGDVGIMWQLRATDHKGVFKDKSEVAEEASKLGDEEFLLFVLYAVFGDGSVITESKEIRLAMGHSKLELWNNIIERLRRLGFRKRNNDRHTVAYVVKSSKAIELAKRMLGNLVIKVLIEDLAQLPDARSLGVWWR